jgi:hypothetical protein
MNLTLCPRSLEKALSTTTQNDKINQNGKALGMLRVLTKSQ